MKAAMETSHPGTVAAVFCPLAPPTWHHRSSIRQPVCSDYRGRFPNVRCLTPSSSVHDQFAYPGAMIVLVTSWGGVGLDCRRDNPESTARVSALERFSLRCRNRYLCHSLGRSHSDTRRKTVCAEFSGGRGRDLEIRYEAAVAYSRLGFVCTLGNELGHGYHEVSK